MQMLSIQFCILFVVYSFVPVISLSSRFDVPHPIILEISVYDVTVSSVEIDWHYKEDKLIPELACDLVYRPVDDSMQVQVFPQIQLKDDHIIKLSHLENNVTYHMYMVCYNSTKEKIQSNDLQFTTGSKALPLNYMMPSNPFHGSVPRENYYSRDEDSSRPVRSSGVVLGAVCGIVGFLIINVTIVFAVRNYSHRQERMRRILEIDERDYDEIPYVLRADE